MDSGIKTIDEAVAYLILHTNMEVLPKTIGCHTYVLINRARRKHKMYVQGDENLIKYAQYEKIMFGVVDKK